MDQEIMMIHQRLNQIEETLYGKTSRGRFRSAVERGDYFPFKISTPISPKLYKKMRANVRAKIAAQRRSQRRSNNVGGKKSRRKGAKKKRSRSRKCRK